MQRRLVGDEHLGNGRRSGHDRERRVVRAAGTGRVGRGGGRLPGDLVLPIVAEGTIQARLATDVRSEIAGEVDRIRIDEGQAVRAGEILVELDPRGYRVALDEARSKYVEALSRLAVEEGRLAGGAEGGSALDIENALSDEAAKELEASIRELEAEERRGKITRNERVRRQLDLELDALMKGAYREDVVAARSGVSAAWAALERARLDMERIQIRAPFAGVVSEMDLTPGQQIQPNDVVCRLVDNVEIEADVGVLESDLRHVAVGRPVLLAVPALDDTVQATLDVISPEVNRESRTCRVLIRFHNADGRARPGMFVRAIIAGEVLPDRLLVPRQALLMRDNRPLVFKADGDRAKWLYITMGERNDQFVEVKNVLQGGSLAEGDTVVVSDHLTLAHEAKIDVRKTITPTSPWNLP